MPIINAEDAAAAEQAEQARMRQEQRQRLVWELWSVECDIERLEIRRRAILEELAALAQEGET
jgi:hypothetical protein